MRVVAWCAFGGLAVGTLLVAVSTVPKDVGAAGMQDWPPFVLVAGLLALGLVARDDGLFDAAGAGLASVARGGMTLFVGAALLVAVVTAVLNLDTAVAFLTPVLVAAARRRNTDEMPFLYLAVFMANGASLLLPGSNLTNLIVLGSSHQSGSHFARAMVLPWIAAVVAVAAVVGALWWRSLSVSGPRLRQPVQVRLGAGASGIVLVVAAMLLLPPDGEAAVAAAVGVLTVAWRLAQRGMTTQEVRRTVNLPVLAGLFVLALDLGTLGRVWSWPAHLVSHASAVVVAVVGAAASVVVNNLPAASLLAARPVAESHALLVGLNLGPNLAVSGALSAVIWLQAGRAAGASPSPWRYSAAGAVVVPVSMALALVALVYAR